MSKELQPSQNYMKGKSKHLFWPLIALYLLYGLFLYVSMYLRMEGSYTVCFFSKIALAPIIVLYAIMNRDKTLRAILILLAVLELLSSRLDFLNFFMYSINGRVSLAIIVCWFVCMLIILLHSRTGVVLRAAAALLMLFFLYQIFFSIITTDLIFQGELFEDYDVLINIDNVLNTFFIPFVIFFFAALSFTRPKQPQAVFRQSTAGT